MDIVHLRVASLGLRVEGLEETTTTTATTKPWGLTSGVGERCV